MLVYQVELRNFSVSGVWHVVLAVLAHLQYPFTLPYTRLHGGAEELDRRFHPPQHFYEDESPVGLLQLRLGI